MGTDQSIEQPAIISSTITYQLKVCEDGSQMKQPTEMGRGKFAKVYMADQCISGRPVRSVAIKILHDYSSLHFERLFSSEIQLMQELAKSANSSIVSVLDIFRMEALIMCGCGNLYRPRCPKCTQPLQRRFPPKKGELYPFVHCPDSKCKVEISAEHIQQPNVAAELMRWPSKPCCKDDPNYAQSGTIINFVERPVIVMELLDVKLSDYIDRLSSISTPQRRGRLQERPELVRQIAGDYTLIQEKVSLLERVSLMVQLAEAVAWLHRDQRIVHKDLAPDNIMVQSLSVEGQSKTMALQAILRPMENLISDASWPKQKIKLIDFGLSDKEQLSKNWYQDEVESALSTIKIPYLSPEARERVIRVPAAQSSLLVIDSKQMRFSIPSRVFSDSGPLGIMKGDILTDVHDQNHENDLQITDMFQDGPTVFARYVGSAPAQTIGRQFKLIRPLGEPHDMFALGALCYYILTGQVGEVHSLMSLVRIVEDDQGGLAQGKLRKVATYRRLVGLIKDKRWRSPIMLLILRAMVRGHEQSLVKSRADRGPGPTITLAAELQQIYLEIQSEVLSYKKVRWLAIALLSTVLAFLLLLGVIFIVRGFNKQHPKPPVTGDAQERRGSGERIEAGGTAR